MVQASAILTALSEILTLGWKVYGLYQESKRKGWVNDGRTLSAAIQGADTDEKRMQLARDLFNHRAS